MSGRLHAQCWRHAFRFTATRPLPFGSLACRWYKRKVLCLHFFFHIQHKHLFYRTPFHTCSIPSSFHFSCFTSTICSSILSDHPSVAFLEAPICSCFYTVLFQSTWCPRRLRLRAFVMLYWRLISTSMQRRRNFRFVPRQIQRAGK